MIDIVHEIYFRWTLMFFGLPFLRYYKSNEFNDCCQFLLQ